MEKRKIKAVLAIKEYFGLLPGETNGQFVVELKALSPESKRELAEGAARELGAELVE